MNNLCPCFSKKNYLNCCKKFHDGAICKNAYELMRSRYSAYSLNLTDYIVKTTHPDVTHLESDSFLESIEEFKKQIDVFCKNTSFDDLKVIFFKEESKTVAFVKFRAILHQNKIDASFVETSKFLKEKNNWYYLSGILQ
jgi:SEC-C motif domain protein